MSSIKGSIGGWRPISIQKICQNTQNYFRMVFENEVGNRSKERVGEVCCSCMASFGTIETHVHICAVSEVQTSIIIQDATRFDEDYKAHTSKTTYMHKVILNSKENGFQCSLTGTRLILIKLCTLE